MYWHCVFLVRHPTVQSNFIQNFQTYYSILLAYFNVYKEASEQRLISTDAVSIDYDFDLSIWLGSNLKLYVTTISGVMLKEFGQFFVIWGKSNVIVIIYKI